MRLLVGERRSEGLKAGGLPGLISLRLAVGEVARALAEVRGSATLLQTLPHSLAPSASRGRGSRVLVGARRQRLSLSVFPGTAVSCQAARHRQEVVLHREECDWITHSFRRKRTGSGKPHTRAAWPSRWGGSPDGC